MQNQLRFTGTSNGTIAGSNTEVKAYGDISLGAVQGDVNITFDNYKRKSAGNQYKNMTGINKATNMYLYNSYVYLTGGLKDITNLNIPEQSGIMISENSTILGYFSGGGEIYLQNEVNFTIKGDFKKTDSITKLTLNPKLVEEEGYYIIQGDSHTPYIKVLGNDETSGEGMATGNKKRYEIYSFNLDDNNDQRYITTSKKYTETDNSDENGKIYINSENETDTRNYYYDEGISKFYLITNDLELKYIENGEIVDDNTEGTIDSIYYIETTIIIPSYADIENISVEDKVYNSIIENGDNVYILENGAFSSDINILYTAIKEEVNGTWKYMDEDTFKNVKRSIYLSNGEEVVAFPEKTNITMIVDGKYYTYRIPNEFNGKLSLTSFKDENGENFVEVNNIYEKLECPPESLVQSIWDTSESYRFIVDFSECDTHLEKGMYDIVLEVDNETETEVSEIYTKIVANDIQIEDRNYQLNLEANSAEYLENDTINIKGTLNLDKISTYNTRDLGKDVVARIKLIDSNGQYVDFPRGTKITINGEEYDTSTDITVKIIKELEQKSYSQDLEIQIDMTDVLSENEKINGEYSLRMEVYLAEDEILLGKHPLATKDVKFVINKESGYGIKIISVDKNGTENSDELQLILKQENADSVTKKVNLIFEKGDLDDGAYIIAKTYKRDEDGKFTYTDLGSSIVVDQKIVNPKENIVSNLIFDSSLENGTYRIEYQLCNKNNKILAKTHINFIVNR